ncbi:ATP-binding protein [Microbacterium sp. MEC084]|jgi:uridine kinase|uniref:uridine kinase family protein n=1 Tax=Microbacterium sp. MEC084 TaxID=1963027 RepID=UPI00106F77DC|nr:ATP-binding protein [Microbacterium sp. MEC084]MCD1269306.1 ATP-binding protein [Microbacterium sp. MEC084]
MPSDVPPLAQVVLIGGASGSGKSRLAEASGLPLLRLDDFYRSGDDPALPRLATGEVDWDHPASWHADRAIAALEELARTGRTEVPVYDIAANGPVGTRTIELGGATRFVAEGVFVGEVVAEARRRGILADALCVRRSRWLTMGLRLTRDLRERRKAPAFLVRRGLMLARLEPVIVGRLTEAGCRPASVRAIRRILAA